ncbi:hypothetical protein PG989_012340 [Apiospora arundinis]|uniref:Uncharacterized protein n=1 Tax=Apiospora arundinis TaxID=335852 RepID=A0ABR2II20_9PEZI
MYPRATPSGAGRSQKRDEWVDKLFDVVVSTVRPVASGCWIGGTLKPGGGNDGSDADTSARGVAPDSVELSAALISEMTEDPNRLTTDSMTLSLRKFKNYAVRESLWD